MKVSHIDFSGDGRQIYITFIPESTETLEEITKTIERSSIKSGAEITGRWINLDNIEFRYRFIQEDMCRLIHELMSEGVEDFVKMIADKLEDIHGDV